MNLTPEQLRLAIAAQEAEQAGFPHFAAALKDLLKRTLRQ